MKKVHYLFLLFVFFKSFAQQTEIYKNTALATIKGVVKDKENNNGPLPFASVFIKGTDNGIDTDFEGTYTLKVGEGTHVLVISFMGYETLELPFEIKKGSQKIINAVLQEKKQGEALKNITLKTQVSKEKETALLLEQKGATIIKEGIGAKRLGSLGISNALAATSKISGVDRSQNTGDIFIRGLSDRYLATTMNGLPIPSDDVSNKNINLNLFSTNILQNISLSKTYNVSNYADNASGNVDISSKTYTDKDFKIALSLGVNENAAGVDFRQSIISSDSFLGFYNQKNTLKENITKQKWDTQRASYPLNVGLSMSKGYKWRLKNADQITTFVSLGYNKSHNYRKGTFKNYRSHVLRNSFSDTQLFSTTHWANGFLDLGYRFGTNNQIRYNLLFINKTKDNVFEQGRDRKGFIYDQDPKETEAFIRDQNLKRTMLAVQQILGDHQINQNHKITWGLGYNYVLAEEPNRIRKQGNFYDNYFQFSHVADFQQRKSSQSINDLEYNGYATYTWDFLPNADSDILKLNAGANFRSKSRNFESLFLGVNARMVQNKDGVDALSTTFTQKNFDNGKLTLRERKVDNYHATLNISAAYVSMDWRRGKISVNAGLRYERSKIDIDWDVANYLGREGNTTKTYENIFPTINLKYDLTEKQLVRLALSQTNTLPEFKELSPFEYVSPNGRVSKGYEGLERSQNQNVDIKWAVFPSKRELFSCTAFYKNIKNPINLTQVRGSSGYFQYRNTGDMAHVMGVELEGRWGILKKEQNPVLSLNANITKMWIEQDLSDEFRYATTQKTALQGAAPLIINTGLTYQTYTEKPLLITLSGNYTSDKILVLGAPEDYQRRDLLYNAPIIEKGFIRLDLVVSKKITKGLQARLVAKNLLNPEIKQTQEIADLNTREQTLQTVSNYQRGRQIGLSISYHF